VTRAPRAEPWDAEAVESRYFDRLVADHGKFDPFADQGWEALRASFVRAVGGARLGMLVDVGCGTGHSRRLYVDHCERYVGIDLSGEALRAARRRFPHAGWVRANACRLPFAADSVGAVAFSSVLHHIDDFGAALQAAWAVLAPGGHVFAFDPNVFHPVLGPLRHPRSPLYLREGVSPNERPLRPAALRAAFAAAGFVDIRQRCQSGIAYRAVAPRLLNAGLALYNLGDRLLESTGLGRWLGAFIVTAAHKPGGPRASHPRG